MKAPLKYQQKAIDSLENRFNMVIREDGSHFVVFKATMGSGKTFVMTKLIQKICSNEDLKDLHFVFIWATIGEGKLYEQSFRAVRSECDGVPKCYLLDKYVETHDSFGDRQLFFVDWEKIVNKDSNGDWSNKLMREQEKLNLQDFIHHAKKEGNKIVLIVDESHIGQRRTTRISEFRNSVLQPDFTFEMSATPGVEIDETRDVIIKDDDVKREYMIKQGLKINPDITIDGDSDNIGAYELFLTKAEERRQQLVNAFRDEDSNVNPLVLIQLPNSDQGNVVKNTVEGFLRKLKNPITRENGKLKIWLNDDKLIDEKQIVQNDNEAEYLIFKTAIQNGWDCPRAHILIKFRDGKKPTPLLQTIGRINRSPEKKLYENDLLNYGYIYTNMKSLHEDDLHEMGDSALNIFVKVSDGKDKTLDNVKSFYRPYEGEKIPLSEVFINPIIDEELCSEFGLSYKDKNLDDIININGFVPKTTIFDDRETDLNEIQSGDVSIEGSSTIDIPLTNSEINQMALDIIHKNCNGLSSNRSLANLQSSLMTAILNHSHLIRRGSSFVITNKFICKYENEFGDIVNKSTLRFKDLNKKGQNSGWYSSYQIPDEREYSSTTHKQIFCPLSLYDKMYVPIAGTSGLETDFVNYLNLYFTDKIEWIWHNEQDHSEKNFGIQIGSKVSAFRPDFLIKFKNGMVGIFDTKTDTNHDIQDTKEKACALYKYLSDETKNGSKIFGGIVTEYNGMFYINQKEEYDNYDSSPSDYERFDSVIKRYV